MNKYLSSIGFGEIHGPKIVHSIIEHVERTADYKEQIMDKEQRGIVQYRKRYVDGLGILSNWSVEGDWKQRESYMPYLVSPLVQLYCKVNVEPTMDGNGFYCEVEDPRIGISVIFRLINFMDYIKCGKKIGSKPHQVSLSALSIFGMIILGVKKEDDHDEKRMENIKRHHKMLQDARNGNHDAAELLAREDYEKYQSLSIRIVQEDLYSLVESCFMPQGMSSDGYYIVGDIVRYRKVENEISKESIYVLTVDYNAVLMDIAINESDLLGEPEVGRRFKGEIWLQGIVQFHDERDRQ